MSKRNKKSNKEREYLLQELTYIGLLALLYLLDDEGIIMAADYKNQLEKARKNYDKDKAIQSHLVSPVDFNSWFFNN